MWCGTIFLIFKIFFCSKNKLTFYIQIHQFCLDFIQIIFRGNFPRVFRDLYNADDTLRFYSNVYLRSTCIAFDFLYSAFYFFRMCEHDSDEDAIVLIS